MYGYFSLFLKSRRSLFREAAGEESGLYERLIEVILEILTLPPEMFHILMYNVSPERYNVFH